MKTIQSEFINAGAAAEVNARETRGEGEGFPGPGALNNSSMSNFGKLTKVINGRRQNGKYGLFISANETFCWRKESGPRRFLRAGAERAPENAIRGVSQENKCWRK